MGGVIRREAKPTVRETNGQATDISTTAVLCSDMLIMDALHKQHKAQVVQGCLSCCCGLSPFCCPEQHSSSVVCAHSASAASDSQHCSVGSLCTAQHNSSVLPIVTTDRQRNKASKAAGKRVMDDNHWSMMRIYTKNGDFLCIVLSLLKKKGVVWHGRFLRSFGCYHRSHTRFCAVLFVCASPSATHRTRLYMGISQLRDSE